MIASPCIVLVELVQLEMDLVPVKYILPLAALRRKGSPEGRPVAANSLDRLV